MRRLPTASSTRKIRAAATTTASAAATAAAAAARHATLAQCMGWQRDGETNEKPNQHAHVPSGEKRRQEIAGAANLGIEILEVFPAYTLTRPSPQLHRTSLHAK